MSITQVEESLDKLEVTKRHSYLVDVIIRLAREKPLGLVGGVIVLILCLVAIFADQAAPYAMDEIHLGDRLSGPSATYIFGTDDLGRDLLSRIIYGSRVSVIVGLAGSFVNTLIAASIGLTSAYFGGKFDLVMQRFVDAALCFPSLFIMLTIMSVLGPGLLQVILVLGLVLGIYYSRVIRSAVIAMKESVYIEAAKAIGASHTRIITRHILHNVMPQIIIVFTISSGYMILGEATLSFLGYGIPPPFPSWGGMLAGSGRQYMYQNPWMALWPGLALTITVFGLNMLGDALRDILDPRLRGGLGRYGHVNKKKATKLKSAH